MRAGAADSMVNVYLQPEADAVQRLKALPIGQIALDGIVHELGQGEPSLVI